MYHRNNYTDLEKVVKDKNQSDETVAEIYRSADLNGGDDWMNADLLIRIHRPDLHKKLRG